MGIHCEINLYKPSDGVFVAGNTVSGILRYAVNEDTVFKNITISLKGIGHVVLRQKRRRRNRHHTYHRNSETYVDMDCVLHNDEKGLEISIGAYETPFSFVLPPNIPSSVNYRGNAPHYIAKCAIEYYVRIKFERPGFMNFAKKYKKVIHVISGITPRLPTEPCIYGEQKTLTQLTQLFSSKKSILNMKATIPNSITKSSEKLEFIYEVKNDTNILIQAIETKLIEQYTFTTRGGRQVQTMEDVIGTESKTGSIKSGESQNMAVEIIVPMNKNSLDHSNIVQRDYIIYITAELPMPHRNAVLKIPVQVCDKNVELYAVSDEPPPSYWEAMGEDNKDDNNSDDIDDDKSY